MSAEEKILAGITAEAKAAAEQILGEADNKIAEMNEQAKAEAKAYSGEVVSGALRRAKTIRENAESAANLVIRDAKLAKKLDEIYKTVDAAKRYIVALPDAAYFEKMVALAARSAKGEKAMLYLGTADIKRDTACVKGLLEKAGVNAEVQTSPAPFDYGILLKYGDIEYNLSLESVISEKRELLEDKINTLLFAD